MAQVGIGSRKPFLAGGGLSLPPVPVPVLKLGIIDEGNVRIKVHTPLTLAYDAQMASNGKRGICTDGTFYYVTDTNNNCVIKFQISTGLLIWAVGTFGVGDDNFNAPVGICTDGTYLYVTDQANNRVKKHLCTTGAYVAQIGVWGVGPGEFINPAAICTDGTHLYITQNGGWPGRLEKYTLGLVYVAQLDDDGHVNACTLLGICTDGTDLYLTNSGGGAQILRYSLALVWMADYCTQGIGDDQFISPCGICADNTYLYIVNQTLNEIKKHLLATLAFSARFGTFGVGDDNFNVPYGICIG
ncbi:MAG: hypothetical protein IMZ50_14935 [Candidatus Atribacteria bacterium]|nr:hypothetical protein [Candidatus Atribacteria bacterium]